MTTRAGKVLDAAEKLREMLRLRENARAPQTGFFSTLDELVQQAPFERNTVEQWRGYLKPGRMLRRGESQFPLKAEEVDWALNRPLTGRSDDEYLTREELLKLVREGRPQLGLDVMYDHPPESDRYEHAGKVVKSLIGDELGNEILPNRIKIGGSAHYGPESGEQLSFVSPGSSYEESITKLENLGRVRGQHFGADTLSHSRASTHDSPLGRARLIEEIQSDVHQKAADRPHWTAMMTPDETLMYQNAIKDGRMSVAQEMKRKAEEKAGGIRQGYRSPEDEKSLADLVDVRRRLNELELRPGEDLTGRISNLESKPPDAPFKDPKGYGALELKKQLLQAVYGGDDALTLTRGDDQVARYSQGDKSATGTRHVYDNIYRGELDKLGRRYGAKVETLPVRAQTGMDLRPSEFIDADWELPSDASFDLFDEMESARHGQDVRRTVLDTMGTVLSGMKNRAVELANENVMDADALTFDDLVDFSPEFVDMVKAADEDLKDILGELRDITDVDEAKELVKDFMEDGFADQIEDLWNSYEGLFGGMNTNTGPETEGFPGLRITEEMRQRIKDEGLPLWMLVGAAPGAGVLLDQGREEEPQKFAKGGAVRHPALELEEMLERALDGEATGSEVEKLIREHGIDRSQFQHSREEYPPDQPGRSISYWKLNLPPTKLAKGGKVPKKQRRDDGFTLGDLKMLTDLPADYMPDWIYKLLGFDDPEVGRERDKDLVGRAVEGFASQWMTLNEETGRPELRMPNTIFDGQTAKFVPGVGTEYSDRHFRPGIEDEIAAIGSFWGSESGIAADERQQQMHRSIRDQMGLDDPEGFWEHGSEALGMMFGQLPVPASVAKPALTKAQKLKKLLTFGPNAALEFVWPTVTPGAANYLSGAGFGGVLGWLLDEDEEEEEPQGYSRGGKVKEGVEEGVSSLRGILENIFRGADVEEGRQLAPIDESSLPEQLPVDELDYAKLQEELAKMGDAPMTRRSALEGLAGALLPGPRTMLADALMKGAKGVKGSRSVAVEDDLWKVIPSTNDFGDPEWLEQYNRKNEEMFAALRAAWDGGKDAISASIRAKADAALRDAEQGSKWALEDLTSGDDIFEPFMASYVDDLPSYPAESRAGLEKYEQLIAEGGNFNEVEAISRAWRRVLGDDPKYAEIVARLKDIEDNGL